MKNISHKILKNAFSGWIMTATLFLVGVISIPLFSRIFSEEEYGIWIIATQCFGYFSLVDIGISNSLSRFVASSKATNDDEQLSLYISASLQIFMFMSVILLILVFVIKDFYVNYFEVPNQYISDVKAIIIISGVSLALSLPFRIGLAYLYGRNDYWILYRVRAILTLTRIFLLVLAAYLKIKNMLILCVIWCVLPLLTDFFSYLIARKYLKNISIRLLYFSKLHIKNVFSLSGSALLVSLSNQINRLILISMVGKFLKLELVPLIYIPFVLIQNTERVSSVFKNSFLPLSSHFHSLKNIQMIQKIVSYGTFIIMVYGGLVWFGTFFIGFDIIKLWLLGAQWAENQIYQMWMCFLILIIGLQSKLAMNISSQYFKSSNNHWPISISRFLSSLLCIIISYVLIQKTQLKLYSLPLALALSYFLEFVVMYCIYLRSKFPLSIWSYLTRSVIYPLLPVLFSIFTFELLEQIILIPFYFKILIFVFWMIFYIYFILNYMTDPELIKIVSKNIYLARLVKFFKIHKAIDKN